MNYFQLALKLGWSTLRSRPTLTALAVLLLALGTCILGVVFGALILIGSMESEIVSALTVELELAQDSETARHAVMERAEGLPGVESVQFIPAEVTLREIEKETGEDLTRLFGANPFPPLVRVHFAGININSLDSMASAAKSWPEVTNVVYPRALWSDIQRTGSRIQGMVGWSAAVLAFVVFVLVGLCLRAQVRNRAETWEFLILSGISSGIINLSLLVQEVLVGLLGGVVACGFVAGLAAVASWLSLREVSLPAWFYLFICGIAILFSVIAGLLSPRKFNR
ncbi:hypothetical protein EHM69_09130 [candidate division KSB1 bacterium]|nr:MAG: hypothetical protein EHM69_09130 [candidate division KSB1 bacterium]